MRNFYNNAFTYLLVMTSIIAKSQVTPNQNICPGTTIQYNVTSGIFAGKPTNWTVVGGIFTTSNSTTTTNSTNVNIIRWNNNITSGSFTIALASDGTNQTFRFNIIPVTTPNSADNISAVCGSTNNVQSEVRINKADASGSQAQGIVVDGRNFTLPAGMSYVSASYLGEGTSFGQSYTRYRVTFSVNGTVSGQGKFKSFYSCSTEAYSTGILSSVEVPFSIIRTAPAISFSSIPPQSTFCTPGGVGTYAINVGGVPSQLRWTVTGGNLLINGSSTLTTTATTANITANGNGTFSVVSTPTTCASGQSNTLNTSVRVGPPQSSTVTVDNTLVNPGPVSVSPGSTHYFSTKYPFGYVPNYSVSATTNSGNIVLNLTGVNNGDGQINVSGTIGNASLNIVASNQCGSESRSVTFYIPASLLASPNPARSSITVAFSDTDDAYALPDQLDIISEKEMKTVKTVNIQEVFKKKAFKNGKEVDFDISDVPRGTYYLRVTNSRQVEEKQTEMIRLIFE